MNLFCFPRLVFVEARNKKTILANLPHTQSTSSPVGASLESVSGNFPIKVLDSIYEDGPKLINMDDAEATELSEDANSPFRVVPVVYYDRPIQRMSVNSNLADVVIFSLRCVDAATGAAVADAEVVAITNLQKNEGASGFSDANGDVNLKLNANVIERLYIYSPKGYWDGYRKNVSVAIPPQIKITPIDLSYTDCVRHYYGNSNFDDSVPVKVGIIDSGVGPHSDLNIDTVNSRNTVTGELASDFLDGGDHGTHVAGIVGSNGLPGAGLRGVAPNVEMVAFRVFPVSDGASNYAILKAMIFAADAKCDIINLSLGSESYDYIVHEGIIDARNQGMLVVAASGNDGRDPVNYPAAYNGAIAVSAMGREGTYPAGSLDESSVKRPPHSGADPSEFIADFSNVGIETNCTGPGVGVLSTLPNDEFGPMSGTSMAAPAVAGAAACLLSQNTHIYNMNRDEFRADAIWNLLIGNCSKRGFGADFEGVGLPDPAVV